MQIDIIVIYFNLYLTKGKNNKAVEVKIGKFPKCTEQEKAKRTAIIA
jgi:hypothetical protein